MYCRISSDPRDHGLGVERQRQECYALAASQGWDVVQTLIDNDVSAYSGKRRPSYEQLMTAVTAGQVDVVVAWHPDRLHRSLTELRTFIGTVERAGVDVQTVTAGRWDLSSASGRYVAQTLGLVAEYESQHRSERLRAKLEQNAARGVTHGRATYGWRAEYGVGGHRRDVIHEAEAEVVRSIARDVLAGESLRSITARLNADGVPSPRGGEWQKIMVRHLVLRERNAGLRVHRGEVVGPGTWPPILDAATYEQVRAVLRDPTRRVSTGSAAAHLLSGIARCGVCNSTMRVAWNRTVHSYRCSGRSCVSRRKADVDELVAGVVVERLARPDAADLLAPKYSAERRAAADEAQTLRARLDTAADDYADGKIDARQLERISSRLRPALASAEAQARAVDDAPLFVDLLGVDDVRAAWERLSLSRQRAVVDALLTVVVLPTRQGKRTFDPTTVSITWRS